MAYLLILFSDEGIFIFHTKKKNKKVDRTCWLLHCLLVVRVAGSSDCNRDSATSFDLSHHLISLWMARA